MKKTFFVLFTIFISTFSIFAQISPTPVINNEIRDNSSVKMRSIELERVKRSINKITVKDSQELAFKFSEIKEEFESIQKLQAEIIKAYTVGKKIDYAKISNSSADLLKKAIKLNENLFNLNPDKLETDNSKEEKQQSVRDLIIDLDKTIESFVNSPIFTNKSLVDSKVSEKTGLDLENIIKLSIKLSQEAKKFI